MLRRVEELEKMVAEYRALLKEKETAKSIMPKKLAIVKSDGNLWWRIPQIT